jgi:hypothetical protein
MFFSYALQEAVEMMTSVWARPTAGPVLAIVGLVAAAATCLNLAGAI